MWNCLSICKKVLYSKSASHLWVWKTISMFQTQKRVPDSRRGPRPERGSRLEARSQTQKRSQTRTGSQTRKGPQTREEVPDPRGVPDSRGIDLWGPCSRTGSVPPTPDGSCADCGWKMCRQYLVCIPVTDNVRRFLPVSHPLSKTYFPFRDLLARPSSAR